MSKPSAENWGGASWRFVRRRGKGMLSVLGIVVGAVWASCAWAAEAGVWDLPGLMRLLAQRQSGEANFIETRLVQALDEPQVSSGRLSFTAPDRMVREVIKPRPESVVVQGNQVTLTRQGRTRTLSLDSVPEMQPSIEAIRGTLTGNAQALQKHFEARVNGSAVAWTLDLVPKKASGATSATASASSAASAAAPEGPIQHIRIEGRQDEVHTVEVSLADGDRSLTRVEPLPSTQASRAAVPASGSRAR